MDMRVPVPGGFGSHEDDQENVPLTPRIDYSRSLIDAATSSSSSSASSTLSTTSSIETDRSARSYLAFFRSPPSESSTLHTVRFRDTYGVDKRARRPLYPLPEQLVVDDSRPNDIDCYSSSQIDDEDDDTCDPESQCSSIPDPLVFPSGSTIMAVTQASTMNPSATPGSVRSSASQTSSTHLDDNLSMLSSASHLFGESLVRSPATHTPQVPEVISEPHHSLWTRPWLRKCSDILNHLRQRAVNEVENIQRNLPQHWVLLMQQRHRIRRRQAAPPLSPRSRNLADLHFLLRQHKSKVDQLFQDDEDDRHFDFCLILQPQEVYAFWSVLLDFRPEILGQEAVELMEDAWMGGGVEHRPSGARQSSSTTATPSSASSSQEEEDNTSEAKDVVDSMTTPTTGMHRRRAGSQTLTSQRSGGIQSTPGCVVALSRPSPSIYSMADSSRDSRRSRLSVFERALQINTQLDLASATTPRNTDPFPVEVVQVENVDSAGDSQVQIIEDMATPITVANRRRWGNPALLAGRTNQVPTTPFAMSPPIRSLTRGSSMVRRPTHAHHNALPPSVERDPHVLRMEDIPNQVIPRGIVARTNGMLSFLSALKRGIVLRRHRPGQEADFCRIVSSDGGDTIHFQYVDYVEAMNAFKEQRVRYNNNGVTTHAQAWSTETTQIDSEMATTHKFSVVPDYVAAKEYRIKMMRDKGMGRAVLELCNRFLRQGAFWASEIVAVHPARNYDPRSNDRSLLGTNTLRRSKSEYAPHLTFSVVTRHGQRPSQASLGTEKMKDYETKWHEGEGSDAQFRYIDFEAATEGEYWLVLRGFVLLHRDASTGRFAEQRAAGIGSHYSRLELEQREQLDVEAQNELHQDEFHEPVTVGCLEKMIARARDVDTTYMEGFTLPGAVPPPSDYFLGFRSPGTSIWSRLRLAGLETQRVYSLDPRRVMIKIRCPNDRLLDVAEVLRVKLKIRDGSFAPFREDMIDLFEDVNDPLEVPIGECDSGFHFRSSIRQTIIDFIIGSRIRDSGAELGQTTDLGRMIQARVPLHMKRKLEAIYDSWVFFWRADNWQGGGGRDRSLGKNDSPEDGGGTKKTFDSPPDLKAGEKAEPIPCFVVRFFRGCFYQPLDSIEQYFGEKVAFYFAWLQHTSTHLVFLSAAGLVMFFCEVASNNWDHPLRPFFAMVVMMWTFITLIDWKKRANFLAYRWGTMDYKEQEATRPQFHGDYATDEITGEWIVTYPRWKRWFKYAISFPLTLLFTFGTLIVILSVNANRDLQLARYMERKTGNDGFKFNFAFSAIAAKKPITQVALTRAHLSDPTFWFIVIGMPSMLGLFLPLLNFILMRLSIMLNDFENYRTESEYRSYLIIKVFSFRFVCYFASLYYYAFVSVGSKQAVENGILRVGSGVLVYTTVSQYWQNFLHVCFPIIVKRIRMNRRNHRLAEELRQIELEEEDIDRLAANGIDEEMKHRLAQVVNKRLLLEQAQDDTWLELMNPQHDSFPEYIQAVVQFTFVSCFSVVMPLTPLICLVNYLVSMRLDAYKLCKGRRRPLAEKTGGIGVWEHLLHIVATLSVLTNCWLMGFTNSSFTWIGEQIGQVGLFAIVVGWEHLMLLVKYIMQTSISPVPKTVSDAMKKEQYDLDNQRNASLMARRLLHQRIEEDPMAPRNDHKATTGQSPSSS